MDERFEFTVEGIGDFPLDMLRHDAAYPADKESVAAIMAGLAWAAARKRTRETLVVRLVSQGSTFAGRSYRMLYLDGAVRNGGMITISARYTGRYRSCLGRR